MMLDAARLHCALVGIFERRRQQVFRIASLTRRRIGRYRTGSWQRRPASARICARVMLKLRHCSIPCWQATLMADEIPRNLRGCEFIEIGGDRRERSGIEHIATPSVPS